MLWLNDERLKFWREDVDDPRVEEAGRGRDRALPTHDNEDGRPRPAERRVVQVEALQIRGAPGVTVPNAVGKIARSGRDSGLWHDDELNLGCCRAHFFVTPCMKPPCTHVQYKLAVPVY
eukprot:6706472-Prymnesium_polylepis.1